MAGVEQKPNFREQTGANVRNVGIVIAIIGLLPALSELVIPGAGLAASGEIFRRTNKPKQK